MASSATSEIIGSTGPSTRSGRGRDGKSLYSGGAEGGRPPLPERVYTTGLIVALCGIAMFFLALASAYVVRQGLGQNDWRAYGIPRVVWLNTVILVASSVSLVWSRGRLALRDETGFRYGWLLTVVLGLLFLAGQFIAWSQLARAGVYLSTNPSSGFFYLFTAAHAAHLLGGIAILGALALREPKRMGCEAATKIAAAYWHFLTVLWILILLFLAAMR